MTKAGLIIICSYLLTNPAAIAQDQHKAGTEDTKIIYKADKKIFPCKWRNKRTNPEFSLLAEDEIPRMQEVLRNSLAKYPAGLIKKNLKNIYVLRKLFFFGLEYGGTYYKRNIYITNNGIENAYTNDYLEGTFHHEFSSVLLRHARKTDKTAWTGSNPPGFTYGGGGVEALRTHEISLTLDSTLFEKGFLNEYSLASFEEDFNCYAEYIFRNDPGFWDAWESSEAIRRKTELLISIYHRIDPVFTLDYFRGL